MKPFIAIPAYQGFSAEFSNCVMRLACNPKKGMRIEIFSSNPYIGLVRNKLAANFLETDCTDILFIDSDIIFFDKHIERILSHTVPIVGGIYYKKMKEREAVIEGKIGDKREDGLLQVQYIGTGFLRISREVFELMIEMYTKEIGYISEYTNRKEWDFFMCGVYRPTNRWLSEDWYFCQRALDLGFKIYADTKCVLEHIGQAIYPL
jgi:hypothetical protein